MARRSRRRQQLRGLGSDSIIGLSMLVAGLGLAYLVWRRNSPTVAAQALLEQQSAVAGLADCGCNH